MDSNSDLILLDVLHQEDAAHHDDPLLDFVCLYGKLILSHLFWNSNIFALEICFMLARQKCYRVPGPTLHIAF